MAGVPQLIINLMLDLNAIIGIHRDVNATRAPSMIERVEAFRVLPGQQRVNPVRQKRDTFVIKVTGLPCDVNNVTSSHLRRFKDLGLGPAQNGQRVSFSMNLSAPEFANTLRNLLPGLGNLQYELCQCSSETLLTPVPLEANTPAQLKRIWGRKKSALYVRLVEPQPQATQPLQQLPQQQEEPPQQQQLPQQQEPPERQRILHDVGHEPVVEVQGRFLQSDTDDYDNADEFGTTGLGSTSQAAPQMVRSQSTSSYSSGNLSVVLPGPQPQPRQSPGSLPPILPPQVLRSISVPSHHPQSPPPTASPTSPNFRPHPSSVPVSPTGGGGGGTFEEHRDECTVCCEKPVNCVLYTCGHMCMCFDCATAVQHNKGGLCPICRQMIRDVIRTYRS